MTETTTTAAPRRNPTWLVATIAGFFGLFYAYAVWNAIAFMAAQSGDGTGLQDWAALILDIAFPILAFAAAFAIGYRRKLWEFALVMLVGLALTAVVWLNVIAYAWNAVSLQLVPGS